MADALGVRNKTIIAAASPISDTVVSAVISLMPYLVPSMFARTITAKKAIAMAITVQVLKDVATPRMGRTDSSWKTPAMATNA